MLHLYNLKQLIMNVLAYFYFIPQADDSGLFCFENSVHCKLYDYIFFLLAAKRVRDRGIINGQKSIICICLHLKGI